ncbi:MULTISPECIES: FixH family protein [Bradyrhizobium]|uniref:Heavy metal RND transporter n=1 Tax=Bradyrhizobium ottawaense TaxID=931866 RepID=A0A2U8PL97_9BRAD|nr:MULTISPECIES: FixH family protein [Bradyrhizobium]AWL98513.1 heavy metal RND transporter [Bradyrhizobium ottawaense]MBR1289639.1 FixH family protein [Bradyrhizobium ottawaense]MBR1329924.1 FixH family protein [Bradyrhizobium ottawaense]MBR1337440.1 FixH family protein [Bradyrhizobium ottawaense]MDA9418006.1 conserved exported protein implied in the cusBA heavy metal efflux RND system [Bradyrhizobium sp. CCBAU 25360]
MLSKFSTAALAATLSLAASAAMAGPSDYAFEPVTAQMKKGDDVTLSIRLTNKQTGKPVADAVIFKTRVDMAPDGMAEMESAVAPLPSQEPGVYAFRTDLPMAGRYQVTLSAKVQGESETVTGKVIVTATK